MNTPAHLIFGAAAFARPDRRGTLGASLLGALLPDLSLYLMASVSILALGIPAERVFRELYYSDAWQAVFAIDNSIVLWGVALALCLWWRAPRGVALTGAALLHLVFDLPLHTHDARQHFWPVTPWVFESPFSYWDRNAGAGIIGPVETGLSLILAALVAWRFRSLAVTAAMAALLAMEFSTSGVWRLFF